MTTFPPIRPWASNGKSITEKPAVSRSSLVLGHGLVVGISRGSRQHEQGIVVGECREHVHVPVCVTVPD